jgi:hypothetical protein
MAILVERAVFVKLRVTAFVVCLFIIYIVKQFGFQSVGCRMISALYFGKNGAGRDGALIYALSCLFVE